VEIFCDETRTTAHDEVSILSDAGPSQRVCAGYSSARVTSLSSSSCFRLSMHPEKNSHPERSSLDNAFQQQSAIFFRPRRRNTRVPAAPSLAA
jgi:hypothetical protein